MATMLDVSLRAGVSKATVSRVLNGTGQVKESTRQQVFAAMEELGYRPNFLARSLANQTSNSIGLADRNPRQTVDRHRRSRRAGTGRTGSANAGRSSV